MFRLVLLCAFAAIVMEASPRVRPIVPMLDGRIVGGENTIISQYPYQLSLMYLKRHTCGASVLTPTRALTAAHCTEDVKAMYLSVRAGSSIRGEGGQVVDVKEIKQHPDYDTLAVDYDVSVLILEESLKFGSVVKPIAIHGIGEELEEGAMATVTGWGILCAGCGNPSILQVVELPKVSDEKCEKAYGKGALTDRMVCHGYSEGGKDACQGDSGGPLVVDGKQVGIVSWGRGCGDSRYPGVFTRVAHKSIHDYILQNS